MTSPVTKAIRDAAAELAATSDTARLDAEVLMAHALGVSRSDLLLRHMGDPAPATYAALTERRLRHEPVAYITGTQEFFGLPFGVGPEVLIPRADSEVLVERALAAQPDARRVLDCGTGSGALLLATLAHLSGAEGIGIDRSPGAVALAAANAQALGLADRATMLPADWSQQGWGETLGRFDLVLANPPYVEADADLAPSVRAYEPAGALFAGADGLADYRLLIPQLARLLTPDGTAFLEIGASQSEAVRSLAEESGFATQVHQDLGGRARVVELALRT